MKQGTPVYSGVPWTIVTDARLSRGAMVLYCIVAGRCGGRGYFYDPIEEIITLAVHSWSQSDKSYDRRTVKRMLKKLTDYGYIAMTPLDDGQFMFHLPVQTIDIPEPYKKESGTKRSHLRDKKIPPAGQKDPTSSIYQITPNNPKYSLATSQATPRESVEKEVTKVYTCPSCGRTFESGDEDFLEKHLIDCDGMEEDTKVYRPKGRPFNDAEKVVWTALAACFGGEPRTSRERMKWEIATREIAAGGYGSREVHIAYRRWHEKYKDGGCTPMALSGHMQELLDTRSGFQRLAILPPTVAEITEKIRTENVQALTAEEKAEAAAQMAERKRKRALRDAAKAANIGAYERLEGSAQ